MSHDELKRYFTTVSAEPPLDRTDTEAAIRSARSRRRTRRTSIILSTVLVCLVIGIFVSTALRESTRTALVPADELSTSAAPSGVTASAAADIFGRWKAVELDGNEVKLDDVPSDWPILEFKTGDDGSTWWGAVDGCNYHSGTYELSGGRFSAVALTSTAQGCGSFPYAKNPEAVAAADEVRLLTYPGNAMPTELVLVRDGQVLARYVRWDPNASVAAS
jgi:heat shock protein HslJ